LDKKALVEELRIRDDVNQELRRSHPLNPEVRVGDLLTFGAVSLSAIGLLTALARDRALRRREYADRIRHGAALIAVKADRWREISSHFFDELQPIIVDADAKLKSEATATIRDFWWKEVALIYAHARKAILDEEIENAYLDFYGYDPSIQHRFFGAMNELRAIDADVHKQFLLDTQGIIDSTTLPYFSAKLGNPIRRSCRVHQRDLERRMSEVTVSLRDSLAKIVSASDKEIVKSLISVAKPTSRLGDIAIHKEPGPPLPEGPARWALLIGINHCPKLKRSLGGPSNDVTMFSELLRDRFGFSRQHVVELVDANATRAGIIDALDWISAETQVGDRILFYFSGHGSQVVPDKSKPGYLLTTLVPYDSGREEGQNFDISETELNRYLNKMSRDRRLVVVLDTCHSGGMGENQNALPALHPVADSLPALPTRGIGLSIPAELLGDRPGAQVSLLGNYTLLAACPKNEKAFEFTSSDGRCHGTFSYFLAAALAKAGPAFSYGQVFSEVSSEVKRVNPFQNPQIDGDADQKLGELFGI